MLLFVHLARIMLPFMVQAESSSMRSEAVSMKVPTTFQHIKVNVPESHRVDPEMSVTEIKFYDGSGQQISTQPDKVSVSGEYSGEYAKSKLVDGDTSDNSAWVPSRSTSQYGWFAYDFGTTPPQVSAVEIFWCNYWPTRGRNANPQRYTIEGSNDGGQTWQQLKVSGCASPQGSCRNGKEQLALGL